MPKLGLCLKAGLLSCLALAIYGGYRYGLFHLISTNPSVQFAYCGIAVLYLFGSSPSRLESLLTVAGGVGLLAICPGHKPTDFAGESLVRTGAFIGIGGLATLCVRAIASRNRDKALETLARCMFFVILSAALGTMLGIAAALRPFKYDHFLYAIDVRFGTAVSFLVGRSIRQSAWLWQLELMVYFGMPLAFAILYTAHIRRAKPGPVDILAMMCLNAMAGYGLYFLYPAAGPLYCFGSAFPAVAPAAGKLAMQMVHLNAPPNAMPSLHMAGAVAIWWNARPWKAGSILAFVFMLLTAVATMGTGEHYLLDLVVAFPYALAVQAAVTKTSRRPAALVLGVGMTAAWFIGLRFAPEALAAAPVWLMWALAAVSGGVPVAVNALWLAEPAPIGNRRWNDLRAKASAPSAGSMRPTVHSAPEAYL
jgi:hypothetical protein